MVHENQTHHPLFCGCLVFTRLAVALFLGIFNPLQRQEAAGWIVRISRKHLWKKEAGEAQPINDGFLQYSQLMQAVEAHFLHLNTGGGNSEIFSPKRGLTFPTGVLY